MGADRYFDEERLHNARLRAWSLQIGLAILATTGPTMAADVGSRVDLTLTGGPHVGSYSITSSVGCNFQDFLEGIDGESPAYLGDFFNNTLPYSQAGLKQDQLAQVTLTIPNVRSPREDVFALWVIFGDPNSREEPGTTYEIYTVPVTMRSEIELAVVGEKPTTGQGRVSVHRNGQQATIRFSGATAEAVTIEGVIRCNSIVP